MSRSTPRRLIWILASASIGALGFRRCLVQVDGPSMEPTLWPGDHLVTAPARRSWLRVGQIVVLQDPEDRGHLVIKRITGIHRSGIEVRGDDPSRSTDSRRWGPVPATSIRRIALTRWPQVGSALTYRNR